MTKLKRLLFFLLAGIQFSTASAKSPKSLRLSDSEVGVIRTSVGYTTMVQFNTRPTSVVLGDQDAFKIEYVGSGLAIKPLLSRVKTNLFVFSGYDRFSFQLSSGSQQEADFLVKVERKSLFPVVSETPDFKSKPEYLTINTCNGLSLRIRRMVGNALSQDLYLDFEAELSSKWFRKDRPKLGFEAGDFDIRIHLESKIDGKVKIVSVPIESLILMKLHFEARTRIVAGTLKISQKSISRLWDEKHFGVKKLDLGFTPDFLKQKQKTCVYVSLPKKESS